jgi:predicted permease
VSTFAFVIETDPTPEHIQYLEDRLYEFNSAATGITDGQGLAIFVKDAQEALSQGPLAFAILVGMAGGYAVVFVISRYLLRHDLMTASLRALAISGPGVSFVSPSVLGHLFGTARAIPISVANLVLNLIQVPVALMLLSAGMAQKSTAPDSKQPSLGDHIVHTLRESVVWAPLLGLLAVLLDLHPPASVRDSPLLLGHATGGVGLFASGIVLYARRVAIDLDVSVSVIAHNLVVPAVMWGLMVLLGMEPAMTREAVLTLAIPTASIAVILAVQYQTAERETASTLFFSTILSVITMGAFIWLTA